MSNKTVKRRMINTLYWLTSLPLLLISASTILAYDFFCLIAFEKSMGRAQYLGLFLTVCLMLAVFIIVLPWLFRKQSIKQKLLACRWPITFIMTGFVIFLIVDAPSLKNDYSEQDIIPDSPQARMSYELLSPLIGNNENKIDVDRVKFTSYDFLANIKDHETEVRKAWDLIAEERKMIEKLSLYDIVVGVNPDENLKSDMPFMQFTTLFEMQSIYLAYAALKIQKGQPEEGLSELNRLYNTARKGVVSSPLLIHKLLWTGSVINRTIEGVYLIQSLDYTDSKTRRLLLEQFTPLTNDEISIEKVFIGEYIFGKNTLNCLDSGMFLNVFNSFVYCDNETSGISQALSTVVYYLAYKKNRMISLNRYYFDSLIAGAKLSPPDMKNADQIYDYYKRNPTLRNLAGWALYFQQSPGFTMYVTRMSKMKIKSDLLAIHLQESLGLSVSLKDYFTGAPYEIKEQNGTLSTPGADGLFDSEDDVTLGMRVDK